MNLANENVRPGVSPSQPRNLARHLETLALFQPDAPALVSSKYGYLNYAQLQAQIEHFRLHLHAAGLGAGQRVGLLIPEPVCFALGLVGLCAHATAVPLDPRLPPQDLERLMGELRLDACLVTRDALPGVAPLAERQGVLLLEAVIGSDGSLAIRPGEHQRQLTTAVTAPTWETPAFIMRSSGTTGQPKLIPFTQGNLLSAAEHWRHWFALGSDSRCLSVAAPYYAHGLVVTLLAPLCAGGSLAFPLSAASVDLEEWFEALQPTWYSASPAMHRAILEAARARPEFARAHRILFASSGGAVLAPELAADLRHALGFPVLEHYGASEAAQIAVNTHLAGGYRAGSVGRAWPDTLRVVDPSGQTLPPGERGEVQIRGATVTPGYLDSPERNQAAFVDGWYRSGDLGSLDDDGFLYLHGRLVEIVNRGGEKIGLAEVDQALLRHPQVADAAAFAIPHPRLGQDIGAAVVLRPGASLDEAALREHLAGLLLPFKIPRRIQILERLPRGLTDKVQRQALAEGWLAALDSAAPTLARTPIEQQVLALWRRLLESDSLGLDDDFIDHGGDSLLVTAMHEELERTLGRAISDSALAQANTVRSLAAWLDGHDSPSEPLLEFNAVAGRRPLFWFHGDFVHGGYYVRRLAQLLGQGQPLVALAPHGLDDGVIPHSVQAMARERLSLLLAYQPEGPYRLGGYCNGALVAIEVARQLRERGQQVELLALVDPPTANVRPWSRLILRSLGVVLPANRLGTAYGLLSRFGETSKWPWPRRLRFLAQRALPKRLGHQPPRLEQDARVHGRYRRYAQIMARHLPKPLDVPIVYFSADYTSRAWSHFGVTFESHEVPGGHHRCVKDHPTTIAQPLHLLLEGLDHPIAPVATVGGRPSPYRG
jgi:acyl-CoA synthetase (AMP-forming)/AMP-acid ligase II/thioesterase domain-containing protein/acyl carrier protein